MDTLSLVMLVWCGTSMNNSRKSTHTGRSTNGNSSTGPWPALANAYASASVVA
jgi:hypothetical protein